jgi:hypothetical protein
MTPQQLADQALKAIRPSTTVRTDGTAMVAGRPSYELVLQPRDAGSLVGSVRIAIDSAAHVPTRVQVFARGATDPALEVGFTSIDTTTPPASTFDFTPPPGTKVTQATTPSSDHATPSRPGTSRRPGTPPDSASPGGGASPPRVVGTGWTSVLVARVPSPVTGRPSSSSLTGVLQRLPRVQGDWGSGRLLQGTLFSAILTDQGSLAVGAVAPGVLEQALTRP